MSQARTIPVIPVQRPAPKDLDEVLSRLDHWYAQYVPTVYKTLRPGVTDAELDAFEHRSGIRLPPDFRTLYRWHDGQNWAYGGVLGLAFDPLNRVESSWQLWAGTAHESETTSINIQIYTVSHPTGAIREQYALTRLVPFLDDGGGNFVALDFTPDVAGKPGQVITTGRDETHRYVLAPDVGTFLRSYLERLEQGQVTVRQLPGYEREMWSTTLTDAAGDASEGYYRLADLYPGFGASPAVRTRPGVNDDDPMSLSEALTRLGGWLSTHHPDLLRQLGAPASASELAAAERRLGHPLPPEVTLLYSKHRDWGQVFGLRSIPIDQLATQNPATFGAVDSQETRQPYSPYDIQSSAADWLPLWVDTQGNYVGLNQKKYGEVLTFGPGIKPRLVVAEHLTLLMDRYVRLLEAGLVRREGGQLLLPDGQGKKQPLNVTTAFSGFGAIPAVR